MTISVDAVGKVVNIDAVFKNSIGFVVAAPADAAYEWSVTAGGEFVTVEGTGDDNAVGKVTNTFTVLIGEELPTAVDFESTVEDNP